MNLGVPEIGFIGLLLLILFGGKKIVSGTKKTIADKPTAKSAVTSNNTASRSTADYQNKSPQEQMTPDPTPEDTPKDQA